MRRMVGFGLVGIGLVLVGYGAHKLYKMTKRNFDELEEVKTESAAKVEEVKTTTAEAVNKLNEQKKQYEAPIIEEITECNETTKA